MPALLLFVVGYTFYVKIRYAHSHYMHVCVFVYVCVCAYTHMRGDNGADRHVAPGINNDSTCHVRCEVLGHICVCLYVSIYLYFLVKLGIIVLVMGIYTKQRYLACCSANSFEAIRKQLDTLLCLYVCIHCLAVMII